MCVSNSCLIPITDADPDIEVTVVNSEGAGPVTVTTEDGDGDPLTGACYEDQTSGGSVIGRSCDADDGENGGETTIDNLPNTGIGFDALGSGRSSGANGVLVPMLMMGGLFAAGLGLHTHR
jgi:hypothetical protein